MPLYIEDALETKLFDVDSFLKSYESPINVS
jgi:hypothetical protein